jgi:hypothetical protein
MQFDVFGEPIRNTLDELVFDYWVRPGVSRVGSNPRLAENILDGDPTTFWEPDPNDPIEQWWIEVDLGRAVPLERLKLQFVEEGLGDPFLRFIMLLSNRQSALWNEPNSRIGFQLFIPQDAPNTEQREYIFESEHTSPELPPAGGVVSDKQLLESSQRSPDWTGRMIETIRIVITDTRGGRAEQISQEAWEALSVGAETLRISRGTWRGGRNQWTRRLIRRWPRTGRAGGTTTAASCHGCRKLRPGVGARTWAFA